MKYTVQFVDEIQQIFQVKANDEDEAEEKAKDLFVDHLYLEGGFEDPDITEGWADEAAGEDLQTSFFIRERYTGSFTFK